AVPELAAHPILTMADAGLLVSVNSDDPAYFGGYVDDNYAALAAQFGLGRDRLAELAGNSVRSSFTSDARKEELLGEVETWRTTRLLRAAELRSAAGPRRRYRRARLRVATHDGMVSTRGGRGRGGGRGGGGGVSSPG